MPAQYLPIIVGTVNLMVLSVLGFYIWTLRKEKKKFEEREKELAAKEAQVESGYQQIINQALEKERKILEDAAKQANEILSSTQNLSTTSKENLNNALQKMIADIQNEAATSSNDFLSNYKNSLGQISNKSLVDFQNELKKFEADMQVKMQNFRDTLLPGIQKELEAYKNEQFRLADKKVASIIKKVAEQVFNETISLEEHQKLIIDSLEKSRKEGVFD